MVNWLAEVDIGSDTFRIGRSLPSFKENLVNVMDVVTTIVKCGMKNTMTSF